MMSVTTKRTGMKVQFDVATALITINGDDGIAKVWPRAAAGMAGENDAGRLSVSESKSNRRKALASPDPRKISFAELALGHPDLARNLSLISWRVCHGAVFRRSDPAQAIPPH